MNRGSLNPETERGLPGPQGVTLRAYFSLHARLPRLSQIEIEGCRSSRRPRPPRPWLTIVAIPLFRRRIAPGRLPSGSRRLSKVPFGGSHSRRRRPGNRVETPQAARRRAVRASPAARRRHPRRCRRALPAIARRAISSAAETSIKLGPLSGDPPPTNVATSDRSRVDQLASRSTASAQGYTIIEHDLGRWMSGARLSWGRNRTGRLTSREPPSEG